MAKQPSSSNETRKLLIQHRDKLKSDRAAITEQLAPIIAERDALREQIRPLEDKLREMNLAIRKRQQELGISGIDNDLASLERALGARSLTADPAAPRRKREAANDASDTGESQS
jgi:uncharacterized coiled-coil DUF342 family protein